MKSVRSASHVLLWMSAIAVTQSNASAKILEPDPPPDKDSAQVNEDLVPERTGELNRTGGNGRP